MRLPPRIRVLGGTELLLLVISTGCGNPTETGGDAARTVATEAPSVLEEAARAFSAETGAAAELFPGVPGDLEARRFSLPTERVDASLEGWVRAYRARGVSLFRRDMGFGRTPDTLLMLPTLDKYEVLRRMWTTGVDQGHSHEEVVAWLRDLEKEHPFLLTGADDETVEGVFDRPPRGEAAVALAVRIRAFCPDVVLQGTRSTKKLAEALEGGRLFLWWD